MPIETKRLKLSLPLGNESVSRLGINAIFEKIDEGVATRNEVEELRQSINEMDIPDASQTEKGKVQLSNKTDGTSEKVAATEKAVNDARISIVSDYIRQPGYAATTGTAGGYLVTLNPTPTSIPEGFGITMVPHITNAANPTLNINGLGAVPLKDQKGASFKAGKLLVGKPYTFRKVGADFLADNGGEGVGIKGQQQLSRKYAETIEVGDLVYTSTDIVSEGNPISMLANSILIKWSPDGSYLACTVLHSSSPLLLFKRSGKTLIRLSDPATLPTGAASSVAWSPDNLYLAVLHNVSPFLTIYKRSGDVFTKLANPSFLPSPSSANPSGATFSPDGNHLVIVYDAQPYITIYKRIGDSFANLPIPTILPTGWCTSAEFSPDGVHLVVTHNNSPYFTIYKRSGDTFTKLANPSNLLTSLAYSSQFSPDGTKLIVGYSSGITVYNRTGDIFSRLSSFLTSPGGTVRALEFSQDGNYLVMSSYNQPNITLFLVVGDTLNKLPDPSLEYGNGNNVAYSPDGSLIVLSYGNSLLIYSVNYDRVRKISDKILNIDYTMSGLGYALESGQAGDIKDIMTIWRDR